MGKKENKEMTAEQYGKHYEGIAGKLKREENLEHFIFYGYKEDAETENGLDVSVGVLGAKCGKEVALKAIAKIVNGFGLEPTDVVMAIIKGMRDEEVDPMEGLARMMAESMLKRKRR